MKIDHNTIKPGDEVTIKVIARESSRTKGVCSDGYYLFFGEMGDAIVNIGNAEIIEVKTPEKPWGVGDRYYFPHSKETFRVLYIDDNVVLVRNEQALGSLLIEGQSRKDFPGKRIRLTD